MVDSPILGFSIKAKNQKSGLYKLSYSNPNFSLIQGKNVENSAISILYLKKTSSGFEKIAQKLEASEQVLIPQVPLNAGEEYILLVSSPHPTAYMSNVV